MTKVSLVWSTPKGDDLIAEMARVSNPDNQDNHATAPKLIKYLIDHKHWSPFEMVNACVRLSTSRDVSRQILRHRSFSFQEFSGRYAEYEALLSERECRLQDNRNRQNSLPLEDQDLQNWWSSSSDMVVHICKSAYDAAIRNGVAREVSRALLPEGFVPTTMYMNGNLRSWIHYWDVRCTPDTQKEHRLVAEESRKVILTHYPVIEHALGDVIQ